MIEFRPLASLPEDVPDKARVQAAQSMGVWSVLYGDVNEANDHTELGIFGFVPTNYLARRGYFWLCPRADVSRKMLAEAKRAFFLFSSEFGWDTFAFTEMSQRNMRFARFMGYKECGQAGGYQFFTRTD